MKDYEPARGRTDRIECLPLQRADDIYWLEPLIRNSAYSRNSFLYIKYYETFRSDPRTWNCIQNFAQYNSPCWETSWAWTGGGVLKNRDGTQLLRAMNGLVVEWMFFVPFPKVRKKNTVQYWPLGTNLPLDVNRQMHQCLPWQWHHFTRGSTDEFAYKVHDIFAFALISSIPFIIRCNSTVWYVILCQWTGNQFGLTKLI